MYAIRSYYVKVAVIADGHRMNPAAANAFLKTLEEPPPATVIFLLTTGSEGMLPTILSRCQKIRFEPWPEDELAGLLGAIWARGEGHLDFGARPDLDVITSYSIHYTKLYEAAGTIPRAVHWSPPFPWRC